MTEQSPDQSDIDAAIGTDPSVDTSGGTHESEDYHGYSVDDEDQPQDTGDSLSDSRGLAEPLDEGYSPPEKWSAAMGYGNTPLEEQLGETLDQRVAQEIPEPDPYVAAETETENVGGEVGEQRAGRLVDPDEGVREDREATLVADDVGVDGAAAGAEEAAVHVIDDEEA